MRCAASHLKARPLIPPPKKSFRLWMWSVRSMVSQALGSRRARLERCPVAPAVRMSFQTFSEDFSVLSFRKELLSVLIPLRLDFYPHEAANLPHRDLQSRVLILSAIRSAGNTFHVTATPLISCSCNITDLLQQRTFKTQSRRRQISKTIYGFK